MPEWLLAVVVAAIISSAVSFVTSYFSHVVAMRVTMKALEDMDRRLGVVEDKKLNADLHGADVRRLDEHMNASDQLIRSTGDRVGAIEQKFVAIETR